ncbi:MAG: hypothetical protein AAF004_10845, partial [Pseudomonadota bacterium]
MKHENANQLRSATLAYGVKLALLGVGASAMPAAVLAQDATETETDEVNFVDEIVVTAVRSSLMSAQERKRNADVFVDGISAEDIGALPDRSITEVLSRIPGVSISRFAGANDPDHFS